MRHPAALTPLLFGLALTCTAKDKTLLSVRAVSNQSQTYQRTSTYTTPGTSDTNCSGSATTVGNTTTGTANCQTQSTPAQTHQITATIWEVTNIVEADGMRYVITCRGNWRGSNCAPMNDGEVFSAELEGTTMWVEARRGGNQGKKIRIKYKVLDIRPIASAQQ
jgi:hypothetical protein